MKRFMLFGQMDWDSRCGMDHFCGSFDTLEDAVNECCDDLFIVWHIFDSEAGCVVAGSSAVLPDIDRSASEYRDARQSLLNKRTLSDASLM